MSAEARKRRSQNSPSPNTERSLSPRIPRTPKSLGFGEDAVMSAIVELRREHGLILEEILKRLPPAEGGSGVRDEAKLVELMPKDTTSSGGPPRRGRPEGDLTELELELEATAEQERELEEQGSPTRTLEKSSLGSELFHNGRGGGGQGVSPKLHRLVMRPAFDMFFGALICINTIGMVIEEQYKGAEVGYNLGLYSYYGSDEWAHDTHTEWLFQVTEIVFALIFTIEVLLRIAGMGWLFFRRPSEVFDLGVVLLSDISIALGSITSIFDDVALLRLLRAAKLLRLLKLVRTIEGFDALHLMTTALRSSFSALCWSILLLLSILTFVAMIATNFFREFYLDDGNGQLSDDGKEELFKYWGTFTRAMLSLFELTLANWTPICRWLLENLHEGFMIAALSFKLVMGISVVGVINAVFMQETFKVANTDDAIMVRTKHRAARQHAKKMAFLFAACDEDGSGRIQRDEFRKILQHDNIKTWLASMDLVASDADLMFDLLRGDDDAIDHNELINGISQLKGAARSIDMHRLLIALRADEHI